MRNFTLHLTVFLPAKSQEYTKKIREIFPRGGRRLWVEVGPQGVRPTTRFSQSSRRDPRPGPKW